MNDVSDNYKRYSNYRPKHNFYLRSERVNENNRYIMNAHSVLRNNLYNSESNKDAYNYLNSVMNRKYNTPIPELKYKNISTSCNNIHSNNNICDNFSENSRILFGGESKNEVRRRMINDITNPDLFYKKANDYKYYQLEQQQFSKYNLDLMNMRKKERTKEIININPFNPKLKKDDLGKSLLEYNTILNPIPNFTYNRYLENHIISLKKQRSLSSNNITESPSTYDYKNYNKY